MDSERGDSVTMLGGMLLTRGRVRGVRDRILSVLTKKLPSPARQAGIQAAPAWVQLANDLATAMTLVQEAARIVERLDQAVVVTRTIGARGGSLALNRDLAGWEPDLSGLPEMNPSSRPDQDLVKSLNNLAAWCLLKGYPQEALTMVELAMQVLAQLTNAIRPAPARGIVGCTAVNKSDEHGRIVGKAKGCTLCNRPIKNKHGRTTETTNARTVQQEEL